MQRFHTLRIATVLLGLYAGACGDDDAVVDSGTQNPGTKDAGAKDAGDSTKPLDSGKPDSDDDAGAPVADAGTIELLGSWHGEFSDEVIDHTSWNGAALIEFDNDDNVAITQYPKDDKYNPNKFAKQVWTEPTDDGFYYCTVEFSLDTLADARKSTKTADDSDPASGGCGDGDFPWTKLEPK